MRTLLIDIGNTNLKWSWLQSGEISPLECVGYKADGVTAQANCCWSHAEKPGKIVVANVAGLQIEDELRHWFRGKWGMDREIVIAMPQQLGVKNGYSSPEQLGVDRWLALIAAHKQSSGSTCVVDCGTAITIDVLTADGQHQGGLILPGLAMMCQALLDQTHIPPVTVSENSNLLAGDTAAAIAAGSLHAAAALVERVAQQTNPLPKILLTGSDAPQLNAVINLRAEIDPQLVMRGLALVATSR